MDTTHEILHAVCCVPNCGASRSTGYAMWSMGDGRWLCGHHFHARHQAKDADLFNSPASEIKAKTGRRVVQILNIQSPIIVPPQPLSLLALCDDGTIWHFEPSLGVWAPLPMVPQS